MAGLNRLWVRLWMLAGLSIVLSVSLLVGAFIALQVWLEHVARDRIPPEVSAELRRLEAAGETVGARYDLLYQQWIAPHSPINDYALLAVLVAVSVIIAGAVAFVVARRISRPISDVADAAGRIASGELDARADGIGASGETAELVTRFNAMAEEIEHYERERRVLTAGIAHELRTPLTVLKGRLHAVLDGVLPMERAEAKRLLRSADQLSHLVEDLRTLALADADALSLDMQVVDLHAIAGTVCSDLTLEAEGASATLALCGRPTLVSGDPHRVAQIVTNLVTNAIKHAPSSSVVRVTTEDIDGRGCVTVEDEGDGFAPDDVERMFMPFWRGQADREAQRPGSGMGLALAAILAKAQGGRVSAANRDGGGASFCLELPLAHVERRARDASAIVTLAPPSSEPSVGESQ
ncbi:MAG: HAMP domain-containing protein [Alphaproteobacteria bacterium]|nr:HAMP domain-containing protein [Alphaproteobacteria bacterium]MBU0794358.1 HAMP domain-containing protein [Alphaproteobacteria bacterium]MBU0875231.1 HAMP domain-containing protein [Alphaproteobacteria bacterium]MBU1768980.1 HAMP domain-containing protein [Alphaproteobacteria bacterium]